MSRWTTGGGGQAGATSSSSSLGSSSSGPFLFRTPAQHERQPSLQRVEDAAADNDPGGGARSTASSASSESRPPPPLSIPRGCSGLVKNNTFIRSDRGRPLRGGSSHGVSGMSGAMSICKARSMDASEDGSSVNSGSDGAMFQMQMEVTELQNRVRVLDAGTGRTELLELLAEKEEEIRSKAEQLRIMGSKFEQISRGLTQIDKERQESKRKEVYLREDREAIEHQLRIREREVSALVQRCTALDEKLRESKDLRSSNLSLRRQLDDLSSQMGERDQQLAQFQAMRNDLQLLRDGREEALSRIHELERQREEDQDAAAEAVAKLQQEFESQKAEAEEFRRLLDKSKRDRDSDDRSHARARDRLREELQDSAERHARLTEDLKDAQLAIETHRKERASLIEANRASLDEVRSDHAEQVKTVSAQHEELLRKQIEEREALETSLRQSLQEKDATSARLTEQLQLETEHVASLSADLDSTRRTAQSKEAELTHQIRQLTDQNAYLSSELTTKTTEAQTLQAQLGDLRRDKEGIWDESERRADKIKQLESEIQTWTDRYTQVSQALEELKKDKAAVEEESYSSSEALRRELRESEGRAAQMDKGRRDQIEVLSQQLASAQGDLEALTLEKNTAVKQLSENLLQERNAHEAVKSDLAALRLSSKADADEQRKVLDNLRSELRRAQAIIAEKEKAFDELQRGELQLSKRRIAELEEDVKRFVDKFQAAEFQAAEIVGDLEDKLERSESRCRDLNLEMETLRSAQARSVDQSLLEISELRTGKAAAEREVVALQSKLAEKEERVVLLTEQRTSADAQVRQLRAELEVLSATHEREEAEHRRRVQELETRALQLKALKEDEQRSLEEQVEAARRDSAVLRERLSGHEGEVAGLRGTIEERTTLLGDMVNQNKVTDKNLEEARNQVIELQDQCQKHLAEKREVELQNLRLEKEVRAIDDKFTLALREERQVREHLESELASTKATLEAVRKKERELDELEKDNSLLRDKVKRQEAYLKRKLQKERVLKDRRLSSAASRANIVLDGGVPPSSAAAAVALAAVPSSPARKMPRGRSSSRDDSDLLESSSKKNRTPSLPSLERMASPGSSSGKLFPDELDEVLHDGREEEVAVDGDEEM